MPFANPFRRTADRPTLRERAAGLRDRLVQTVQHPEPVAPEPKAEETVNWHNPPPGFMASPAIDPSNFARIPDGLALELDRLFAIAQDEFERRTDGETSREQIDFLRRELRLDALRLAARGGGVGQHPTAGGIAHGDGTVSYTAANGHVCRAPFVHWVGFAALQMHSLVQGEIARQRVTATLLEGEAYAEWEAKIRCELRSDAVHALAFRHVRAFEAAQAIRRGIEPATQGDREKGDAKLLALAPQWEAAVDLYQQRIDEQQAVETAAGDDGWPGAAPEGSGPEWRAWFQQKEDWRERTGVAAAEDAAAEAGAALHEIELRISALPAASLAGLKLKARVAQHSEDIGVAWPDNLGAGLARDILAFIEKAPIARPDLSDPDALTLAIFDGWKAWNDTLGKPEGDPVGDVAYERATAHRDELLHAADALPATMESLPAKAVASAWMEWVDHERPGQARSAYGLDGRLVFDIHTAIIERPLVRTTAPQPAATYSYLVDQIDFASVPMAELLTIRDIAETIGNVAYAHSWGARCRKGTNAWGAVDHNAAGDLVQSLGDALTAVESAAEAEAKRRPPSDRYDRETRLFMLAPATIDNGDPDEIEAFARELLAHAEAERAGR